MSEETHAKKEHREHDEQHLEKLTVKELREMAAAFPHEKAIHDMKKEELIAFIKQAKGIKDEAPAHKHKAKIRELKLKHWQALEDRDQKASVALRHQISRLKKISRRAAAV